MWHSLLGTDLWNVGPSHSSYKPSIYLSQCSVCRWFLRPWYQLIWVWFHEVLKSFPVFVQLFCSSADRSQLLNSSIPCSPDQFSKCLHLTSSSILAISPVNSNLHLCFHILNWLHRFFVHVPVNWRTFVHERHTRYVCFTCSVEFSRLTPVFSFKLLSTRTVRFLSFPISLLTPCKRIHQVHSNLSS